MNSGNKEDGDKSNNDDYDQFNFQRGAAETIIVKSTLEKKVANADDYLAQQTEGNKIYTDQIKELIQKNEALQSE